LQAIPELVPFRLTREIVDGMGPCGVEGTFSRVAEAMTWMLRNHSRDLLTILSAVVADPLYDWQKDPIKARERQEIETQNKKEKNGGRKSNAASRANEASTRVDTSSNHEVHNQAAMKAINKIKLKLQGYEESTSGDQQGVEGQVQLLINSARDPMNLSQMFSGWAPFL
jgi:ataxia telangiectasia mutated family protein